MYQSSEPNKNSPLDANHRRKLLTYLLENRDSSLNEISERTEIPRSETLMDLNDLEHEGFVTSRLEKAYEKTGKSERRFLVRRFSMTGKCITKRK